MRRRKKKKKKVYGRVRGKKVFEEGVRYLV